MTRRAPPDFEAIAIAQGAVRVWPGYDVFWSGSNMPDAKGWLRIRAKWRREVQRARRNLEIQLTFSRVKERRAGRDRRTFL